MLCPLPRPAQAGAHAPVWQVPGAAPWCPLLLGLVPPGRLPQAPGSGLNLGAQPHSLPRMRYSATVGPNAVPVRASLRPPRGSKSDDLLIFSTRAEKGSGGVGAVGAGKGRW